VPIAASRDAQPDQLAMINNPAEQGKEKKPIRKREREKGRPLSYSLDHTGEKKRA